MDLHGGKEFHGRRIYEDQKTFDLLIVAAEMLGKNYKSHGLEYIPMNNTLGYRSLHLKDQEWNKSKHTGISCCRGDMN